MNAAEELRAVRTKRLRYPEQKLMEEARYLTAPHFDRHHLEQGQWELYYLSEQFADESVSENSLVFSLSDIRKICIRYRLFFCEFEAREDNIPYPAWLALCEWNKREKKKIRKVYLCSPDPSDHRQPYLAFLPTLTENYLLYYHSPEPIPFKRKILFFPVRSFETVFVTVMLIAAILAVSLPTRLIWLPEGAPYWGMYRVAAFFHIFIFLTGLSTYGLFAFSGHLSAQQWNKLPLKAGK